MVKRWFRGTILRGVLATGGMLVAACNDSSTTSTAAKALPIASDQLKTELAAKVADGPLLKRGKLTIKTFTPTELKLTYEFKATKPRMTAAESEIITLGLVKFAIDVLLTHGYSPHEQHMLVTASARQPIGEAEPGEPAMLSFGKASYDPKADKISYQRNRE